MRGPDQERPKGDGRNRRTDEEKIDAHPGLGKVYRIFAGARGFFAPTCSSAAAYCGD
jgi:hypothetical protein